MCLNKKELLPIQQIIKTIQCEGNNIGVPSILLRFAGCNLKCPWCDTKKAWIINDDILLTHYQIMERIKDHFKDYNFKNMMITGGEPFLYISTPSFMNFYRLLNQNGKIKNIEIETNGTLIKNNIDSDLFKNDINFQFNISPKLNIEYYKSHIDFCNLKDNINYVINISKQNSKLNYILKFVNDDIDNILEFIKTLDSISNIYLMPLTPDITKYNDLQKFYNDLNIENHKTIKLCMKYGFIYSPRLHLYLFNKDSNENLII